MHDRATMYMVRRLLELEGKSKQEIEEAVEQARNSKWEDIRRIFPTECACGCKSYMPRHPYESGGKWYASAYCILREAQCCSYCGGTYKDVFKPDVHEMRCNCNFAALDR